MPNIKNANDKPTTWQPLFDKIYKPETQKQLDGLLDDEKWLKHVADTAKQIQPDINDAGIDSCISGIVGRLLFGK